MFLRSAVSNTPPRFNFLCNRKQAHPSRLFIFFSSRSFVFYLFSSLSSLSSFLKRSFVLYLFFSPSLSSFLLEVFSLSIFFFIFIFFPSRGLVLYPFSSLSSLYLSSFLLEVLFFIHFLLYRFNLYLLLF